MPVVQLKDRYMAGSVHEARIQMCLDTDVFRGRRKLAVERDHVIAEAASIVRDV